MAPSLDAYTVGVHLRRPISQTRVPQKITSGQEFLNAILLGKLVARIPRLLGQTRDVVRAKGSRIPDNVVLEAVRSRPFKSSR